MAFLSSPDFGELTELAREVGGEAWPILVEAAMRVGHMRLMWVVFLWSLAAIAGASAVVAAILYVRKIVRASEAWAVPLVLFVVFLFIGLGILSDGWLYITYPEGAALLYVLP